MAVAVRRRACAALGKKENHKKHREDTQRGEAKNVFDAKTVVRPAREVRPAAPPIFTMV